MRISVIVSTYNNPAALEKVLWGYACQTDREFEIVIADDGSRDETRRMVERVCGELGLNLVYAWHEDIGFRKTKILNQAILAATGEYLIFTDGDCIPRADFVASHRELAKPGYFIAGGSHIDIPEAIHLELTLDEIRAQRLFEPRWLRTRGMKLGKLRWRLTRSRWAARLLDALTPRPGVLVGCNSAAWKSDVLAVNGFDESFGYGSEDRDLGVRLGNHGIQSRRMKHSLVIVHQSHARPYRSEESVRTGKLRLRQTRQTRMVQTPHGIRPAA